MGKGLQASGQDDISAGTEELSGSKQDGAKMTRMSGRDE